jgi:hypothetical protein
MERWMKLLMFALIGVVVVPSLLGGTCFADSTVTDLGDTTTTQTLLSCDTEDTLATGVSSMFHSYLEHLGKAISPDLSVPIQPDIGLRFLDFSIIKPTGPLLALEPQPPKALLYI